MGRKALILGRFQGFHEGHQSMLKQARDLGVEKILIGIGSPGQVGDKKNPFTLEERVDMIKPVLEDLGVDYQIYSIVDINNNSKYAEHVLNVIPEIDEDTTIVSGNTNTVHCFTNYGHNFPIFKQKREFGITGTEIRDMIAAGDEGYKKFVPQSTIDVLEKKNCVGRIKQLYGAEENSCVDNMITVNDKFVVLVKRSDDETKPYPRYWALPGGRVEHGETLYESALRETKEETGLSLSASQMDIMTTHISDADPRGGYTTVFHTKLYGDKEEIERKLCSGDDASEIMLFSLDALPELAFDHEEFIEKLK